MRNTRKSMKMRRKSMRVRLLAAQLRWRSSHIDRLWRPDPPLRGACSVLVSHWLHTNASKQKYIT